MGIASCPCDGLNLRFHIRLGDDEFSQRIFSQLRKGTQLKIQGPIGEFTLDESSERPLIFIAAETGFAQVQSIIDHAISIDPDRQIALYWMSAIPQGHYLSNYCRAWRDTLDNFHYESIDLFPAGKETLESSMSLLLQQQENPAGSDVYAVASKPQLELLQAILLDAGLPFSQMLTELLQSGQKV